MGWGAQGSSPITSVFPVYHKIYLLRQRACLGQNQCQPFSFFVQARVILAMSVIEILQRNNLNHLSNQSEMYL